MQDLHTRTSQEPPTRAFMQTPLIHANSSCKDLLERISPGSPEDLLFGPWHFSCQFSHQITFVTCPCAFRLRRLAQTVHPGLGLHHIFWINFRTQWLLSGYCGMSICVWTAAQARTNCASRSWPPHFSCKF